MSKALVVDKWVNQKIVKIEWLILEERWAFYLEDGSVLIVQVDNYFPT